MMRIDIYGKDWTVRLADPISTELFESDGATFTGKSNCNTKEIVIAKGLVPQKLQEVITHELTHSVINQVLLHKKEFDTEEICIFLEQHLNLIYKLTYKIFNQLTDGDYYDK